MENVQRNRLPDRRRSETFAVQHPGDLSFKPVQYNVSIGYDGVGHPLEVFISCHKLTTSQDIAGRDIAILISMALQHGASIDSLSAAMTRGDQGEPQGVAGAVLDLLKEKAACITTS
jgi:hypothetical protein